MSFEFRIHCGIVTSLSLSVCVFVCVCVCVCMFVYTRVCASARRLYRDSRTCSIFHYVVLPADTAGNLDLFSARYDVALKTRSLDTPTHLRTSLATSPEIDPGLARSCTISCCIRIRIKPNYCWQTRTIRVYSLHDRIIAHSYVFWRELCYVQGIGTI